MRLCFAILLLPAFIIATYKADFCTRTARYVIFWDATGIGCLADGIFGEVSQLHDISTIGGNMIGYGISCTSFWTYGTLLSLLTKMDTCLGKTPQKSTTKEMLSRIMDVLIPEIQKPYDKLAAKAKMMTANKQTTANILNGMYRLASASCTNDLVQHLLAFAQKGCSQQEWVCCIANLPTLLNLKPFNVTYRYPKRVFPTG